MNDDDREMISRCCECWLQEPGNTMAREPAAQLQPVCNLQPHSETSNGKLHCAPSAPGRAERTMEVRLQYAQGRF